MKYPKDFGYMSIIETITDVDNTFLSRREITCNFTGLGGKLKKLEAVDMITKEFKLEDKVVIPMGLKNHVGKPLITGTFYIYDDERFWECHEAFEGVWKQCFGREKEIVNGIILFAVAFAHAQEDDLRIGIGMLHRVLEKLGTSPSMYHSIDVDRIRDKAVEMQQANNLTIFEI